MIYRETGQLKTSYRQDQAILTLAEDRVWLYATLFISFVIVPAFASEYLLQALLIPFLILAFATVGLNLLTGYAGQVSLGTGAFMAVGGYTAYKLTTAFPGVNVLIFFLLSGFMAAGVGILFGLPSLRIKGFYLAVTTLAAQFFILWLFNKVPWFYNDNSSGTIIAPPRTLFGLTITGPESSAEVRYLICLAFVVVFSLVARNLVRGRVGRMWMSIRDADIAAEAMGVRQLPTKLLAFAISSFYCGVAGAMYVFLYLGSAETEAFDINLSFEILFMVIIGGLGSILGCFLGAAFITAVPILLTNVPLFFNVPVSTELVTHVEEIIFGVLIVFFLIVEPHGLARLWQVLKEKLRAWPFPYR